MEDQQQESELRPACPGWGWVFRMAWRDSRGQRKILLLSALCILFGIAALVAIGSLRDNLGRVLNEQTRSLLGADLALESRQPFVEAVETFVRELGGEQSREMRFQSMAVFPGADVSRFVQVRAIEGGFPFYGSFETNPTGKRVLHLGEALVEESLMLQLGLVPGDRVRLGEATFEVVAALQRIAGESEVTGFFAPRIFIPWDAIEGTELVQPGSMVRYRTYFRFDEGLTGERAERVVEAREGLFVDESVGVETVEQKRRRLDRLLGNLFDFLNLVGFVALLLGGLGVGGAVQVYVREKLATLALLRCLGSPAKLGFRIYLLQVAVMAFVGAVAGTFVGVGVQFVLPLLVRGFLPFDFDITLSWPSIGMGLVVGWAVALTFALIPLLGVRGISPLAAIRADFESTRPSWKDPAVLMVYAVLSGLLVGFSILQTREVLHGLGFAGGLLLAIAILAFVAVGLRFLLRTVTPAGWPFSWRLGLGNLHRPRNRTVYLIVTLGMGVFLINTLYLARSSLLAEVSVTDASDAANVVLLDVQPDQLCEVEALLGEGEYVVHDVLPIVAMRLQAVNGRSLAELRRDPNVNIRRWVHTWEFRSSYRPHLLDNEVIAEGEWLSGYSGDEPYPISVAANMLEDMGAAFGDRLSWDIQGVPIETRVHSTRDVTWKAGRQNFAVVFPPGSIDEAPTVYAVTVKVMDRAETIALQQNLVAAFPNVSVIDLTLVFETLDDLLGRAAFVVQFMAGFTLLTGFVVLAGAIITSRYQRIRESALLRTLGAGSGLIYRVMAIEYALIGACAGLAGAVLAQGAGWGLIHFVFEGRFTPDLRPVIYSVVVVSLLTLATGLINSRRIATESPLVLLREET